MLHVKKKQNTEYASMRLTVKRQIKNIKAVNFHMGGYKSVNHERDGSIVFFIGGQSSKVGLNRLHVNQRHNGLKFQLI